MATKNIFKPILFNTEMVQAILAGRKTQTRRVVKNQPPTEQYKPRLFKDHFGKLLLDFSNTKVFLTESTHAKCQPGDILWVRETFRKLIDCNTGEFAEFIYKSEMPKEFHEQFPAKWKPSLFMPKEAARIFLKVTNVRCERLQDMNRGDAMSEGCPFPNMAKEANPINWFSNLWDSINAKKHPWESNPWVWVYDFEVIEKPENFN